MEQELVWLTDKLKKDEASVKESEKFFEEKQHQWSRDVVGYFFDELEAKKMQLSYEQHLHEKLAWQIVMERDARSI
jgi:hypothetical protein